MFLDNQEKKDCCGCMACSNVCALSAIQMVQDEKGFFYPVVDKEKCVECGQCEKVCPMRENYVGQEADPAVYAVQNTNGKILYESSSGGMFTLLAQWVLAQEGVIYGVAFDESYYVQHKRAVTMEEAQKFRTSKYVDSDISEVYENIKKDLEAEKVVLLTGTPCQVSGVTKYLKVKRVNTERLYTCDNICHGVPSRELWKEYLTILKERYIAADDQITFINMRSKKVSWKQQVMDIQLEKGNLDEVLEDFSFNRFFLSLYGHRPSCFHCRYTSYKRPSDFSLGDFWNVENAGISFDIEGGVNVVLVNTEKGQNLFHQITKDVKTQKVTKEAAWQPHLEYSTKGPKDQEKFWEAYLQSEDKEKIIRKYMKGSFVTQVIRKVSPFLRKTGLYGAAGKLYKIVFVRK